MGDKPSLGHEHSSPIDDNTEIFDKDTEKTLQDFEKISISNLLHWIRPVVVVVVYHHHRIYLCFITMITVITIAVHIIVSPKLD